MLEELGFRATSLPTLAQMVSTGAGITPIHNLSQASTACSPIIPSILLTYIASSTSTVSKL